MREPAAPLADATSALRAYWDGQPRVGVILGTGLNRIVDQMEVEQAICCDRLPGSARATADGHDGRLFCGRVAGAAAIVMSGRCHVYEGFGGELITMPVRLMHALGVRLLILTNASGGMNPAYRSGDVMVIDDHINLMGSRFTNRPPVARTTNFRPHYCPQLIERALSIARRGDFAAYRGVYAAMTGPNYETRAEYRFLRQIGADAVGMSTVPEAMVAAQLGMRVLALSTITNICLPDSLGPARHEDVISAAESAEPKVRRIVFEIIAEEFGGRKRLTEHLETSMPTCSAPLRGR